MTALNGYDECGYLVLKNILLNYVSRRKLLPGKPGTTNGVLLSIFCDAVLSTKTAVGIVFEK